MAMSITFPTGRKEGGIHNPFPSVGYLAGQMIVMPSPAMQEGCRRSCREGEEQ